ncbi:MAG: hypothetical protein H6737_23425 [Alphaproteobacteria bacterium]|nr:hypothetical protein [Alphaproteobacteria bacterium]
MLIERDGELAIHVDGCELMGTDTHGSEDALADLAFDRLGPLDAPRVLVGGLGTGFTLAAVLRRLAPGGRVTVAELVPEVVRWNREHLGVYAGHPLRDPRVDVFVGDVFDRMQGDVRWDAILLDVDNGPRAFTRQSNGILYTRQGLHQAWRALRPGGVLGVWSSSPDRGFTRLLKKERFDVEVIRHSEPSQGEIETHVLWMARRG